MPDRASAKKKRISKAPEIRREELLETAAAVFREKGIGAAGVGDITDRANVARGTFYLYFPSKDALVATLWDRYVKGYLEIADRAGQSPNAKNGLAAIMRLVRQLAEHALDHADLHRIVYGTADAEAIALCRQSNIAIIERLAQTLQLHRSTWRLPNEEAASVASFLFHGVHGALHDVIMQNGPSDRAAFVDHIEHLAKGLLLGS